MGGNEETGAVRAWIRVRGAPDDPESWDLGSWTGMAWEVRKELPNGRRITLQIRDYMVAERLSERVDPFALYAQTDEGHE